MTILLMTYRYYAPTTNMSASDILSKGDYQNWFLESESSIGQFEYSAGPLMEKMVVYGPSTFDMVPGVIGLKGRFARNVEEQIPLLVKTIETEQDELRQFDAELEKTSL